MKPGFAFGGSCLPKDVRALQYRAKEVDLDMPVIQSILGSNQLQIQHALDQVMETGRKRVGLLGFSFKAGHRRSAREPDRHPGRGAPRQGLRAPHLRQERVDRAPGWRQQGIHQQADSAPVVAAVRNDRRSARQLRRHRRRQQRAGVFGGAEANASRSGDRRSGAGEDGAGRRFPGSIRESAGRASGSHRSRGRGRPHFARRPYSPRNLAISFQM